MYIVYTLIVPLITAAICALFGRNSKTAAYVAVIGMTLSAFLFTANWFISTSATAYLNSIAAALGFSTVGLILAYLVIVIGTFITWYSPLTSKTAGRIYYPLLLVIISTTAAAVISTNLATLYILLKSARCRRQFL